MDPPMLILDPPLLGIFQCDIRICIWYLLLIFYGLITDRVVRYCCQNWYFRNEQSCQENYCLSNGWRIEMISQWSFKWEGFIQKYGITGYGITGGVEKSVLWWSLCIHVAIWGFQARTKDMTMIAENLWSHSRDILQLRVEQIPRSEDGTKSCFCGHSNQANTVRTRHSLLHKRVWQIVCDGIKEGGGKIPRGGGRPDREISCHSLTAYTTHHYTYTVMH